MIGTPPPNRDRFLCAIAERVSPDRVQAVFLFPPIRQGPVETCVAVLAVEGGAGLGQGAVNETVVNVPSVNDEAVNESADDKTVVNEAAVNEPPVDDGSVGRASVDDTSVGASSVDGRASNTTPRRPVVLTARYRHTLKGPDRGKWELEILEQADAPLVTIETVVRGVQARLDDQAEPERLSADDLRTALVEGVWTTPAR